MDAHQGAAVSAGFDYDAELSRYHARLLAALDIDATARVLDIGCGAGQTTRAAARAAFGGHAVGVDISAPMLARARQRTALEGLANATFEQGDAQTHPLAAESFTIGLSRFGTMFFADPGAAFANIAKALRPGARFVQLVWQHSDHQEWKAVIDDALSAELDGVPPEQGAESAFSLAEPATVHALLTGAGFDEVQLVEVKEPVFYGPDVASAMSALRDLRMTSELLRERDDASRDRALSRLRTVLDARGDGGVWFDSAAWLVTARRRRRVSLPTWS